MVCIHCGSETQVINSRHQKRSNSVWRRRKCLHCQAIFTTTEVAQYASALRVNHKGVLSPFLRDKLLLSLYSSCQHRKTALADASGLTDTVINRLLPMARDGLLESTQIKHTAQVALGRFDKAASVHYAAFHAS